MRLIITHEQADLDALASQLGAWLLDPDSCPVLSQRLNRNVRAFLTIYGSHLPFKERGDLLRSPIESITLVDTQSMVTLKGVTPQTRVYVVDHHEPRPLPPEWNLMIQPTGANTTLLIESIQEQNRTLSPLQATLLLMGIYEDTGSLTYTRTTPRDLHAAAYLLQQGASLDIAKDYLNHPLSLAQQTFYEFLRDHIETHIVHGHTILFAMGDARELDEELSTIAHKLRDLFEPDGLFLLIAIQGGVQLIARSTDNHVDAAGIALHFGGGGHHRAAAAMIKRGEISALRNELIRILPNHVRPAVTVAQIMSRTPQLLSPGTSIDEAAKQMTRFGYEGYPILENGKIIGLLTRRAVDRAMAHRLNIPIRNLMEAGEITVRLSDSIEHLQRVMVDTGWGQIPVIDPAGHIIGIVTRTDLLKNLNPEPTLPGYQNLTQLLEKSVPAKHLALLKAIAETAHKLHLALYIVGGFVRDLLLERPNLDFDLVVEGDAITLAKALVQKYGGRITTHTRFGTAKWILNDQLLANRDQPPEIKELNSAHFPLGSIDLVSARTEFYTHPTALPTVERGSIKLDLHRRDFTINTLALRLDGLHLGELHDYWGGYNDLRQGVIRVLHSVSFVDDPTRMLRAVRFEQRFGFQIEARTRELLISALAPQDSTGTPLLERVSGDRLRHELDHVLDEANSESILTRMNELGILNAIHPDLTWNDSLSKEISMLREYLPGPEWELAEEVKGIPVLRAAAYILWLGELAPEKIRAISERLKMPQALETILLSASGLIEELPELCSKVPSVITTRLDKVHLLGLYACFIVFKDTPLGKCLHQYVVKWRHIHPYTNGKSLQERGLHPNPLFAHILSTLRAAWLDGQVTSPEEEEILLGDLINQSAV